MIKKIIKFMLIICWMGLIFSFSSDNGEVSTKKSDGFIIKFVETIIGRNLRNDEKEKWTNYLVVPVRKGAHFGVYFILGLLIISFVSEFIIISYKSILLAIGVCLVYAISDEAHQLFVPGRSGQIKDVLLDIVGASASVLGYSFIVRKCFKREQKKRIS